MSIDEAHFGGFRGIDEGIKLAGSAELWYSGALENNGEFGSSGFQALPAGYCTYGYGDYGYMGSSGSFWSSPAGDSYPAWYRLLHYGYSEVYRSSYNKRYGFSVRCVRDN